MYNFRKILNKFNVYCDRSHHGLLSTIHYFIIYCGRPYKCFLCLDVITDSRRMLVASEVSNVIQMNLLEFLMASIAAGPTLRVSITPAAQR